MSKRMSLSAKVAAGFAAVLIGLIWVGGMGLFQAGSIKGTVRDLVDTHLPLVEQVNGINTAALTQELAITRYAIHKKAKYMEQYRKADKSVAEALGKVKELVKADAELVEAGWVGKVEEIGRLHGAFASACAGLTRAVKDGKSMEEWQPLADEVAADFKDMKTRIDSFLESNSADCTRVGASANDAVASAWVWILTVGIVGSLVWVQSYIENVTLENSHQEHGEYETSISQMGQMSLQDLSLQTDIPVQQFIEKLQLPATVDVQERLGRLRKWYGFEMEEVRKIIEKNSKHNE